MFRAALTQYEKNAPDDWERYNCQSLLGASLTAQKKFQEAEPLIVDGYEGLVQRKAKIAGGTPSALDKARDRAVELYRSWGKSDKAVEWAKAQR